MDGTPRRVTVEAGGFISTQMVFKSTGFQNSANATYRHVSSFNAVSKTPYTFKTDRERMLFKIGQLGTVPGATGY